MIGVTDRASMRTNGSMRWITTVLVIAACTHDHNVIVGSSSDDMVVKQFPTSPDLDVLFMVDNSSSTADKQQTFAAAFPTFVAAIDSFPAGRPNLHMGVISSTVDLGPDAAALTPICGDPDIFDGRLQNGYGSGCPTDLYIEDLAGIGSDRVTNYTGTLEDALSCTASPLGDVGCGFEAQMLATQRALDGTHSENAGFLRADADLMIVMLTDEDDCSVIDSSLFTMPASTVGGVNDFRCQPLFAYDCDQPITAGSGSATYTNCSVRHGGPLLDPDTVATYLAPIKDPSQTAVALIAGDPETTIMTGSLTTNTLTQDPALLPSCSTTFSDGPAIGRPAIRLNDFMSHYGPRGSFHSVCQPDYAQALTDIAGSMATMLTSTCFASNVDPTDTDAAMPGVQLACTAADHLDYPNGEQVAIPQCPMSDVTLPDPNGPRPCFWAQTDESCTSQGGSTLSYHVERATPAPAGTVVRIECQPTH
jgi:hypothetical protein